MAYNDKWPKMTNGLNWQMCVMVICLAGVTTTGVWLTSGPGKERPRRTMTIWSLRRTILTITNQSTNIKLTPGILSPMIFIIFSISPRHLTGTVPPSDGWCISWSSSEDHSFLLTDLNVVWENIYVLWPLCSPLSHFTTLPVTEIFRLKCNKRGSEPHSFLFLRIPLAEVSAVWQ